VRDLFTPENIWPPENAGTYHAILADPPWLERGGGQTKRGADRHYPLMPTKEIAALPVGEWAAPVSAPLPTVTTKDRFALVQPVINGCALDIRLRMLKPHELAAAMSFGADYQFAGNQGDQVKQIGNAWACGLGEALIHVLIEGYAGKRAKPRKLEAIA
jgi:site-specific DNA-cytosine methylase